MMSEQSASGRSSVNPAAPTLQRVQRRAGRTVRAMRGFATGFAVEARVVVSEHDAASGPGPSGLVATEPRSQVRGSGGAAPRAAALPTDHRGRAVTVLVPVYNAFDDVRACVDSLIRNTGHPVTLLLIDDASTDPRIAPYLRDLATTNRRIMVATNDVNLGFVGTVNRGFDACPADDVILLNSDTEVPPRWVESLLVAAADASVATVTAMSNNAGAFSAPLMGADNPVTGSIEGIGRAVAQDSARIRPEVHTGNGFCMFVKREAIDELGGFDADTFGRGYCEENDFCMRARRTGWRNVVDDALLVVHKESASFGGDKAALLARNRALLDERHPDYNALVQEFLADTRMAAVRERIGASIGRASEVRPRVLFVLHAGGGGTPLSNADVMAGVADRFEPLLLRHDDAELYVTDGVTGEELDRFGLARRMGTTDFTHPDYAAAVQRVLVDRAIELVHIDHLQGHTHDIPRLAATLGIPVTMSLHDYYVACPSLQLLDDQDRFCAGRCTTGQGTCRTPPRLDDTPHLKHGYVHEWRRRSAELFRHIDAFVTPSESAATVLTDVYPHLAGRMHVIEHGRDLPQLSTVAELPSPGEPARILVPGVLGIHKGAALLAGIAELDVENRLEFHLIGSVTDEVRIPGLVDHGPYEHHQFTDLAAAIRPAATAVLSIWAETFSHTVTESWSVGVPVLGSALGAVGARIHRHGGGWIIDTSTPAAAYREILAALDDRTAWETTRNEASVHGLPSLSDMAGRYLELYDQVLDHRRALAPS